MPIARVEWRRAWPDCIARSCAMRHDQLASSVPFFADLVVIARSLYPIPSRTRPSKSSAPMVLSLKAWKSRSLPGLPRTEFLFTFQRKAAVDHFRGGFCVFAAVFSLFPKCGTLSDIEESPMAKSETIRARVEPTLKREAEAVLDKLGMTPTEAITLFYTQVTFYRACRFRSASQMRPRVRLCTRRALAQTSSPSTPRTRGPRKCGRFERAGCAELRSESSSAPTLSARSAAAGTSKNSSPPLSCWPSKANCRQPIKRTSWRPSGAAFGNATSSRIGYSLYRSEQEVFNSYRNSCRSFP